jgi:hypothetical protein
MKFTPESKSIGRRQLGDVNRSKAACLAENHISGRIAAVVEIVDKPTNDNVVKAITINVTGRRHAPAG